MTTGAVAPVPPALDSELPTLGAALDPAIAGPALRDALGRLTGGRDLTIDAIRAVRHKPAKRCLIEYDLTVGGAERVTVIGKVRRERWGGAAYRLVEALWEAGFDANSGDRISVPEPLGVARPLRAWLQRRVPGAPIGPALAGPGGADLAARVAEVAHKIHLASPLARRRHGIADELAILQQRLGAAGADGRLSRKRADRLLAACDRLGGALAPCMPCGIHRDFYADQVIADGARLWVIDFDLYCVGDPALDVGNFAGHITEQALREFGDPGAMADREQALETRAAELEGQAMLPRIHAYAALTLVRHVELSTVLDRRAHLTGALFDLAEERVRSAIGEQS